jgi:hypothetical protein
VNKMMLGDVVQLPPGKLREVLIRGDIVRGPPGPGGATWVYRMMNELNDVGVETARDFIEASLNLNYRLGMGGYQTLSSSTIKTLCHLCCDAVYEGGVFVRNDSSVVAPQDECYVDAMLGDAIEIAMHLPGGSLCEVLMRGAGERGLQRAEAASWCNRMMDELSSVGIESARDFIEASPELKDLLAWRGYGEMAPSSIKMLCRLCSDVIYNGAFLAGHNTAFNAAMGAVDTSDSQEVGSDESLPDVLGVVDEEITAVSQVAIEDAVEVPEGSLREVLVLASDERNLPGPKGDEWVSRILDQLYFVGVQTARDFIEASYNLNDRLDLRGRSSGYDPSTVKLLCRLCCDVIYEGGVRLPNLPKVRMYRWRYYQGGVFLPRVPIGVVPRIDRYQDAEAPEIEQLPEGSLFEVLLRGASEQGSSGSEAGQWTRRMMDELWHVQIETARDFIESSWTLNTKLALQEYDEVDPLMIQILCRLCCDAVYNGGVRAGQIAALHAARGTVQSSESESTDDQSDNDVPDGVVAVDPPVVNVDRSDI